LFYYKSCVLTLDHICTYLICCFVIAGKIIEHYEKSYGDVIGGAIGGTIGLGLIIAFGVWVAWRYRQE